jgi:cellulose biosynthesis protein BcsQ
MMKDNCLLVSVESRKGGVGKTTAALNLARILLEKKGYAVLFLDVDITGTNATDVLDSPFWTNICHTVNFTITDKEPKRANLLEIFDRRFMAGFGIPKFRRIDNKKSEIDDGCFIIEESKINVIGSQIYDQDNASSKNSDGKNIICEPGILFDELHAFWFVEFLQEICANFIENIREDNPDKFITVIIDNSPGYVGIAPAIQEWLTDLGPEKGKYLTVSSLDKQDLLVCGYAIHNLHRLFSNKWSASRKFMQAIHPRKETKKEINLTPNEEGFFLRLVESKHPKTLSSNLEKCTVDVSDTGLSFYQKDNSKKGDAYCSEPEKYQGLLINRVPRLVKSGIYAYEIEDVYSFLHRQTRRVLSRLLGDSIQDLTAWMVSYDEYIEFQFFEPMIYRGDDWMPPRMRHFGEELMHFIRERHFPPLFKELQFMLQEGKMMHPEMLDEVRMSIQKLHESVSEIIRLLEQYG